MNNFFSIVSRSRHFSVSVLLAAGLLSIATTQAAQLNLSDEPLFLSCSVDTDANGNALTAADIVFPGRRRSR